MQPAKRLIIPDGSHAGLYLDGEHIVKTLQAFLHSFGAGQAVSHPIIPLPHIGTLYRNHIWDKSGVFVLTFGGKRFSFPGFCNLIWYQ